MIYAVINQKGGVGKSTTAATLWAGLNKRGYKALAVELDAQGNLAYIANANNGRGQLTALSVLTREARAEEAIQHTESGDVIAANKELTGADAFITSTGKEYRLKEALESLKNSYDYIIIDTPPALGILTINALTAADRVIIPVQADILSLQGIDQLMETITPVKQYCNPNLKIEGIIIDRYETRTVLTRELTAYLNNLAAQIGTKVFESKIREAITLKEAQLQRKNIFDYAPRAKVTADYNAFIDELIGDSKQ